MRIPDFKNLELKHVTFSKGYDDKDTLKDFVKIRHYFDELEDYEISIDKRKKKEFTEKELLVGFIPHLYFFFISAFRLQNRPKHPFS